MSAGPLTAATSKMADTLEELFGSGQFVNMMNNMIKSLNPFQGGLDKISKAIFPKLIGGMLKMIPITALLEPLTALIGGLMVFMEPLSPILEAFGTVLGTSLLPLTTWLADKLMYLFPYLEDFATWLGKCVTKLTEFFDMLEGRATRAPYNFLEALAAAGGADPSRDADDLSWLDYIPRVRR